MADICQICEEVIKPGEKSKLFPYHYKCLKNIPRCLLCHGELKEGEESPFSKCVHFECDIELIAECSFKPDAEEIFWEWYWDVMINC